MPLSPEKVEAFAAVEAAIDQLKKAFGYTDSMMTGWVLLTQSVAFNEDSNDPECTCDELDLIPYTGVYYKRGMDPILALGMLNEAIRHHNSIQLQYGGTDE